MIQDKLPPYGVAVLIVFQTEHHCATKMNVDIREKEKETIRRSDKHQRFMNRAFDVVLYLRVMVKSLMMMMNNAST
jgi:siroheme synthase (precorrin-2 oxidase/ferrochelatase)